MGICGEDPVVKFRNELPRKMTIHILSNNKEDCKKLVEFLTGIEFPKKSDQLLETDIDISKKINLYSFMNYKVYNLPYELISYIKRKAQEKKEKPANKKLNYSEVILVLNNKNIEEYLKTLKEKILKDDILSKSYYTPFIIFLYLYKLDLKDFDKSKTFQYRTSLKLILNWKGGKQDIDGEIINEFYKRLNIIFSYYNELGDEFSFINSKRKKMLYKNIDDSNILDYINIVLLGKTGAGKSTLINIMLDEKKSIEGGTRLPSTSKNFIIYQKDNIPLRFYDVRGIEDDQTLINQIDILSNKPKNVILYLIEYTNNIIDNNNNKLFEKLVKFKIPILFVITKCPFNPYDSGEYERKKYDFDSIKYAIESSIEEIFRQENKKEDPKIFIKNYVKIYYINKDPLFGFDKLFAFFTEAVSKKDWDELKESCLKNDSKNCKKLCENNFYLKLYGDLDSIRDRNKKEAENYLKTLQVSAIFTGWIPIGDMAFESYYQKKFISKIKTLYGIDYDDENSDKAKRLNKNDILEIINEMRNAITIIRGIGEVGLGIGKAAAATSLKVVSWAMLPVTIIGFSAISYINIGDICHKILNIFDDKFTQLRFIILLSYVENFRKAVDFLEKISQNMKVMKNFDN